MKRRLWKRIFALCLVGILSLSLAACGNGQSEAQKDSSDNTKAESGVPAKAHDTAKPKADVPPKGSDSSGADTSPTKADETERAGQAQAAAPTPAIIPDDKGDADIAESSAPGTAPGESAKPSQTPAPAEEPKTSGTTKPSETPNPSEQTDKPTAEPSGEAKPQAQAQPQEPAPAHTHNFAGGDCYTPSKCSCGATGEYAHVWEEVTVFRPSTGHFEQRVTEDVQVIVGYEERFWIRCLECLDTGRGDFFFYSNEDFDTHCWEGGCGGHSMCGFEDVPIYETRDIVEDVWVEDTPTLYETVTICSICGAIE